MTRMSCPLLLVAPRRAPRLPAQPATVAQRGRARSTCRVSETVVALTNVRVVDGTGAPPRRGPDDRDRERQDRQRGPAGRDAQVPAGARTIDLAGHTVIPGPRRHARPHVLHDARAQRAAAVLGAAALSRLRRDHDPHDRRHVAVSRDQHEERDRPRPDSRARAST